MSSSQNGFPALQSGSNSLHRWIIPGCKREFTMRYGAAGFVLMHFMAWFHDKVERLDIGTYDDWGWAFRPVRGATDLSNHASGTALDANATLHPMGVVNTFNLKHRLAIRVRMQFYRGCIRWGGDYTSRKDDMHFEIDRGISACEVLAKALLKTKRGQALDKANPGQRGIIYS